MKNYPLHIIKYTLAIVCTFSFAGHGSAEGIRIIPRSITVRNDSLHLFLEMDLNAVHVNSLTAISFIPLLHAAKGQTGELQLPPVVISGSKRYRFERRERALATGKQPETPYLVLLDTRKTSSKNIRYRVSVPYVSWMQNASLLLRQEIKDCCDLQLLGVDTLKQNLAVTNQESKQAIPRKMINTIPDQAVTRQESNPVPTPVHIPIANPLHPAEGFAEMVSTLNPPTGSISKDRTKTAILYIDYPLGKDDVYPNYRNNREEIDKIDGIIYPLLSDGLSDIGRIRVRGYASPDGNYGDNERLSANRSRLFARYLRDAYHIPGYLFDVSSVAEDWDGLEELLLQTKPAYYLSALDIIHRYGIFGGREKQLMELQGGVPYKEMLHRLFPKLRRIEIVVEYRIRKFDADEIAEMIYTHPDLLSLEEMYGVARYYRPGTEQYREVYEIAAFHFPGDVIANVNAASAVMLTGDLKSAWNYLRKVEDDPRSWNNMGVLTLMEGDPAGATVWFRKAVGIEPRKARQNLQIAESYLKTTEE